MAREMTRAEHKRQRELVLQALMLADTRAERHGSYPKQTRKPKRSSWSMPSVNERRV